MSRMSLKRIGAWSVFKFSAVLYLIFFLIFFILFLVVYLIAMGSGAISSQGKETADILKVLGLSGGVTLVVFFFVGLFSSIVHATISAIGALIYNIIAWMTGGIEVKLEEKKEE